MTMSRDNRLWGTERIRGELLKLDIAVSNRSIRRYRWQGPTRAPSQTWRTFLRNHAHHLWAADLLTVPTLTFRTLYVLVFIAHGRRELVHVNVTVNPTAAWVWRQLIEATPWGQKPRHLLRDRDAVYGRDFRKRAQRIGIDAIATLIHAPKAKDVRGFCRPTPPAHGVGSTSHAMRRRHSARSGITCNQLSAISGAHILARSLRELLGGYFCTLLWTPPFSRNDPTRG